MDFLTQFLEFCEFSRSLSINTVKSYRWDLRQFMGWIEEKGLEVIGVKIRDIDAFIISLRKTGISAKSVNRKICCLRSFYKYLQRIEVLEKNPLVFVARMKEPRYLPRYLDEGQQKALIEASLNSKHSRPKWGGWLKTRDHLMIILLLDTGLRISELCQIKKRDIDLQEGTLLVYGKGSKERMVILSDRCIRALQECLKEIDGDVLFLNQQIRPLGTRHAFRLVQSIGKRAGISNLHPHILRHTMASNLRKKGADLQLIQESLGHSSIITTSMYSHISTGDYNQRLRDYLN